MNKTLNFTKADLLKIKAPEKGFDTYSDMGEKGLKIYVTPKGVKTFFIRKMIDGRDERFIIGNFPDLTVKNARDEALKIKTMIAKGKNPNDEKKKARAEYTFGELFDEYMVRYSKPNKKSWKYDEREIPRFAGYLFNRKLSKINNQEVRKLHEMTKANNGLYQANRILERLRAMYNKAIEWGYTKDNPTNGIKKYKEVKRDRFLHPNEVKAFFDSLEVDENEVAKNYFKMLLFTGARKTNVLAMRWDDIDLDLRIWRIPDTKNGEPLDVPLIDYAFELLNSIEKVSEWVFPSETSENGHFADPKRPWKRILKRADIENLRIHDVRRTLGSWQAITGSSLSIIGRSLGHKSMQSTQIYARLTNDPVRDSMTKAIDKMYEYKEVSDE
ncbi:MAG: site-specific integrase [Alphaproteobacteria bacterium]|nr:site-specific integrase [Alphaproteobacteria bacterium]